MGQLKKFFNETHLLIAELEGVKTTPSIKMQSGVSMQQLAVGMHNVPRDKVSIVINAALTRGCRNFDFASVYDNEMECGEVLREWLADGHDRSELFITTKVWTTDMVD